MVPYPYFFDVECTFYNTSTALFGAKFNIALVTGLFNTKPVDLDIILLDFK